MKHASTLATTSHEVIQSELTAKDASAAAAAAAAPVTTVTTASGAKKHAFHCERCPATFGRRHDLMRHTRIHLGIRPYVCGKCGKHFSRQDALRRHTLEDGEDGTPNPLADGSGDCKTLMARREREARQGGLAAAVVNLAAAQAAAGMMQAQGLMMPSASSSINASLAMPGMGGMLFH
ncbi:hypothetical protein CXG81DRAFT_12292 [Caulochytrium protostelioides]|uniref:C2H2-type domain-containing protein n=1 Tax=Caulochytrium protostelioides TaxID=1555241 RepID=A0A4P9X7I7_9FUNG|nr:hypothetical protein CXG81DRAFT_12292 [Caulochytrium protostelioides]|eukprot:RKP01206.1 hypothetical protein CXG81DRAFT_12292 [Caulochytrium protostelioides]